MKEGLKNWFGGLTYAVGITLIVIVVIVMIYSALFFLWAGTLPFGLSVQRNAVEESKSYIDSANSMMVTYMQDYTRNETNPAQQQADLNAICEQISHMKRDTVSPMVSQFIASKGGCR